MSWKRLDAWDIELMAVVEVTRDAMLVSIRRGEDGIPGDIISVATGRTADVAFKRAMNEADSKLSGA